MEINILWLLLIIPTSIVIGFFSATYYIRYQAKKAFQGARKQIEELRKKFGGGKYE